MGKGKDDRGEGWQRGRMAEGKDERGEGWERGLARRVGGLGLCDNIYDSGSMTRQKMYTVLKTNRQVISIFT